MNYKIKRNLYTSYFWILFGFIFLILNFKIVFFLNDGIILYIIIYMYILFLLFLNILSVIFLNRKSIKYLFYFKLLLHLSFLLYIYIIKVTFIIPLIFTITLFILGNIIYLYDISKNKSKIKYYGDTDYIFTILLFILLNSFFNKDLNIPYIPAEELKFEINNSKSFLEANLYKKEKEIDLSKVVNYEWELYLYETRYLLNIPFLFNIDDMRNIYRYRLYDYKINQNISSIYIPMVRKNFLSDLLIKKGLLGANSGVLESLKYLKN